MLYITVDSLKCMAKARGGEGDVETAMFDRCGGTILPQMSISFLLLLALAARLYLVPLQTAEFPTKQQLADFEGLSPKHKIQIIFTALTVRVMWCCSRSWTRGPRLHLSGLFLSSAG
jgi:hypothetical protein